MSIIDYTNFIGKLNLPQTGNTEGRTLINQFIEIHETEYLKKVLGYDLWKAFVAGIGNPTLGPELITNGGFVGNANGWEQDPTWVYNTNKMTYQGVGGVGQLRQLPNGNTPGSRYRVSFNISGQLGYVIAQLGFSESKASFNAGSGNVYFDGVYDNGYMITFFGMPGFDGSITNVSVKEITSDPSEQRWLDLLNGKEFEYASRNYSWNGFDPASLITPIANYVYYKYMEEKAIDNTLVGTATGAVDNNTRTNPVPKTIDAWNSMVEMNKTLWYFLKANKDTYPEWTWWAGSWDYWLWTDTCKQNEVFHFKNCLDL